MKLYRDMNEAERRRDDRVWQRTLKNLKEDAELTMEWFDSLDPLRRAELREPEIVDLTSTASGSSVQARPR